MKNEFNDYYRAPPDLQDMCDLHAPNGFREAASATNTGSDNPDLTKDDANHPHACLCGKGGCGLSAFCPCFHFGQAEWTR